MTDAPSGARSGRLAKIWIKRFKRGPMDPSERAELVAGRGLVGNANQGGKRQVTLLSAGAWAAAERELGERVDPATRRANLLVEGLALSQVRGRALRIGDCRLLLWGETRPCNRMEEAHAGLQAALSSDWRGGCYGEVTEGGTVRVGDPVWFEEPDGGGGADG